MESHEALVLLTRAGLIDGRLRMDDEALESKARYWAEVLGDMTLHEGLAALVEHHRQMTTPPLPAHLLAHVRIARKAAQRPLDQQRQRRELTEWNQRRPFTPEERAEADRAFQESLAAARAARSGDTGVHSPA